MTMLVEDFEDVDRQHLYQDLKVMIQGGIISDSVTAAFEEWRTACGLPKHQLLVHISTVFPQKMLLSLIESGFRIDDNFK